MVGIRILSAALLLVAFALAGAVAAADAPTIEVSPSQFSPNGDGVRDELFIVLNAAPGAVVTVRVHNSAGKLVATLVQDLEIDLPKTELSWDGLGATGPVPDGVCTIKVIARGAGSPLCTAKVVIDSSHKWPPIKFTARSHFPIGVWFEGKPSWGGYPGDPTGARQYYDRSFVDIKVHGFNTVTVPNCPETLWETLLQSAQRNGMKVILEIGPLAELVSEKPITESRVYTVAKRVFAKIGKYPSLVRYQIRDEPGPALVENWVLVQRILAAVDPARPAFSCFNSRESLDAVVKATKLSEAVFDIYPIRAGAPPRTLGAFLPSLDSFTRAAGDNVVWPVPQAFAKPDVWRYPTTEELRAMTYLSLAAGARGIFYFLYQSMPDHPDKLEGLVSPTGEPTAIHDAASTLAKELRKLSPFLMSLKRVKPAEEGSPSVEGDARSGNFVDPRGRPVLIVASTRPDVPVTVKFRVRSDTAWRDEITRESLTPVDSILEVPLAPGGGRVLVSR